jgi:hypothetical protein
MNCCTGFFFKMNKSCLGINYLGRSGSSIIGIIGFAPAHDDVAAAAAKRELDIKESIVRLITTLDSCTLSLVEEEQVSSCWFLTGEDRARVTLWVDPLSNFLHDISP